MPCFSIYVTTISTWLLVSTDLRLLTDIRLTPHLMLLCFTSASVPSSWLLSAFVCQLFLLSMHTYIIPLFFFSLFHIRLKLVWCCCCFLFFLSSISALHEMCNFLFSNFNELCTESVLIWYLQVLPFYFVRMTDLASPSFSYRLYPQTYWFPEQYFISN